MRVADRMDDLLHRELTERYGITPAQSEQARNQAASSGQGLLPCLCTMGLLTDRQAVDIEGLLFGVQVLNLKVQPINAEVVQLLPEVLRNRYQALPVGKRGNVLTVAVPSLTVAKAGLTEIEGVTGSIVDFALAYPGDISERMAQFSQSAASIDAMLEGKAKQLSTKEVLDKKVVEDPDGPIAKAIHHLIVNAINIGVSDIHLEPLGHAYRVRFREDGVMREVKSFDKLFAVPIGTAVKVMAGMDIAETRFPQDGAINVTVGGRKVDLRVATYPAEFGEKIVMRILDSNKDWISLDALALCESEGKKLLELLKSPQGLILVAGPTGSGKTTSIYALLAHVNTDKKNILTIEDPIEYRLQGITQAQVNHKKGFNFAAGLRAMLRLDPNIVFIGEVRDTETAETGVQAALTGHLVLSTIHANSASQTVARLCNMGVDKYVLGSALKGVISQRLVRRLCDKCRESFPVTPEEAIEAGFKDHLPQKLYRGRGCHACNQSGYRGRIPVIEMLVIQNEMRGLISQNQDPGAIFRAAIQNGMKTILEDALDKVRDGITTVDEVWRTIEKPPVRPSADILRVSNAQNGREAVAAVGGKSK